MFLCALTGRSRNRDFQFTFFFSSIFAAANDTYIHTNTHTQNCRDMTEVAKLPLNCERLEVLDESTMAACGQHVVYFCPLPGSTQSSASASVVEVSLRKSAVCLAPWHPPGAALQECGVFYAEAGRIHFCRCCCGGGGNESAQESRDVLESPPPAFSGIEEMRVFFGTTLVVRTAESVACYALDPTRGAAVTRLPLVGRVTLPHPALTGDSTEVLMMDGSPAGAVAGDDDHTLGVVMYCGTTQRVSALLLAVEPACVTVQGETRSGGLALPFESNASLRSWSFNWSRREVLFLFADAKSSGSGGGGDTTKLLTRTLSLATMEWAVSSTDLTQLSFVPADVGHTHTGDIWAVDNSFDGVVKFSKLFSGSVTREVVLQRGVGSDAIFLTAWGSSLYVLMGRSVLEVREDDGRDGAATKTTLCDWLMQQVAREPRDMPHVTMPKRKRKAGNEIEKEIDAIVAFLRNPACSSFDMIVRDCRYVSCTLDAAGEYSHAILDAIQKASGKHCDNSSLVRYIAVAQSLHPLTILRVLSVSDPSIRLSLAVLLSTKPTLVAGGVRLLAWGPPVRAFCRSIGYMQTKLFTAALCETALTALAAGALGAVGLLCAVADVVMITALGNDKRGIVSREEAAAEVAIVEAVGVLSSYAQWALAAAPALGTITAHVGPVRNGRKEAAVRDRVAHSIILSRSVQITPLSLLERRHAT
ncbi:hypothetical protein MOQ_000275 [Trypanosoma cruzi marinkellei]|uniref:Uncharacterized protein n=1 Tax=Trypanosoma cruzi marinkellei TaxID=85056 RepID=K2NNU1_TRYCR|nr:hypothetical protein MOQ_000275 [Trypanosoma cruzi marinkellei]